MPKPRQTTLVQGRPLNRLLAGLPDADFERLRPHLRTVAIQRKQMLHNQNEPLEDVIFPNGGVISVTSGMQDGTLVEIATVGDEGMVGMDAFFGGERSTGETMLQVPDTSAEFLSIPAFKTELARGGPFYEAIRRYSQGLVALIMQSTACVALHPVQERCCRWLLMTHDRVRRDDFQLSQEFLAMMLASTRPTVSVVASTLQNGGLISYTHGRMTIVDRQGLEDAACECYRVVKSRFDQLGL